MKSLDTLGKGAEKKGLLKGESVLSVSVCVCTHMHVHAQEARDKPILLKSLCFTSFISSLDTDYFEQR